MDIPNCLLNLTDGISMVFLGSIIPYGVERHILYVTVEVIKGFIHVLEAQLCTFSPSRRVNRELVPGPTLSFSGIRSWQIAIPHRDSGHEVKIKFLLSNESSSSKSFNLVANRRWWELQTRRRLLYHCQRIGMETGGWTPQ
jgi:hypothetical protein